LVFSTSGCEKLVSLREWEVISASVGFGDLDHLEVVVAMVIYEDAERKENGDHN